MFQLPTESAPAFTVEELETLDHTEVSEAILELLEAA